MVASGFFRGRDEARIGRNVKNRGASEFSLTPRFLFTVRHYASGVSPEWFSTWFARSSQSAS